LDGVADALVLKSEEIRDRMRAEDPARVCSFGTLTGHSAAFESSSH
jgi:hypothetical protein